MATEVLWYIIPREGAYPGSPRAGAPWTSGI